jgi:hypothetical protein
MIHAVADRLAIGSVALCSYDPAFDDDGRAASAGVRLLGALAEHFS